MNHNQIQALRRCILNEAETVRSLLLTNYQIEVYSFIWNSERVDSNFVAKEFVVSIYAINSVLKKLVDKGYLTRSEDKDPTGGKMYWYKAVDL